ncbi:MAG: type II toxin-antitoxin system VapC family toxin [Actinomycetia bacterium]|nr:type II toxin-antitoxin system VapC family toxin [Actinomycetes bacterium]
MTDGEPVVYVDTSALGALLIDQPESEALLRWLDSAAHRLVSCDLLETELRRVAVREGLEQSHVTRLLEGVSLAALDRASYRHAGLLPMPYLRTLDALHLEAAVRLDATAVLTYDRRLAQAAAALGLDLIAPGVNDPVTGG